MMPIVNLFNEWHAASTSKKIKAVIEANAKAGKYRTTCAPFGYTKGDDPNHLPVIDPDAAPIVRNIFEMRASGISPHHIADKLNEDGVPIPSDYYYAKLGKPNPRRTRHMWSPETVRQILHNYTYLGHLVQLRTRTVSYKNHKVIKNDEDDMIVVKIRMSLSYRRSFGTECVRWSSRCRKASETRTAMLLISADLFIVRIVVIRFGCVGTTPVISVADLVSSIVTTSTAHHI